MKYETRTDGFSSRRRRVLAVSFGVLVALNACNMPAVSETSSTTQESTTKDASAPALLDVESFAICPDGSRQSGLNLIGDPKSWQVFVDSTQQRAPALAQWKPNFSSARIVLVRLGAKSSAGYDIKAVDAKLKRENDELMLTVQTSKPAPGSLSATVLTSPCLVVSIANSTFKTLTVFDLTERQSLGQIAR